jgi:hypothetical protein
MWFCHVTSAAFAAARYKFDTIALQKRAQALGSIHLNAKLACTLLYARGACDYAMAAC